MLPGDSLFIIVLPAILVAYLYGVLKVELRSDGRPHISSRFLNGSLFSFILAFMAVFLISASTYFIGVEWLRSSSEAGQIFTATEKETIAKGYASGILFITAVVGLLIARRSGIANVNANLFSLASAFHAFILSFLLIVDVKILSADVRQHAYGQYGLTTTIATMIAAGCAVLVFLTVKAMRECVREKRFKEVVEA